MRTKNEIPPSCLATPIQGVYRVFCDTGLINSRWSNMVLFSQMNITVTENALKQMSDIIARNDATIVRYELRGGGCSGLMAHWDTEPHYEPEEGDGQWTIGENRFFIIDKFTLSYMDGATIDYTGDFMPTFKVTIPDRNACGCGESFQA